MPRRHALYAIYQLLRAQLPDLPDRLQAVLALWVEGTLLGLNGCQDTVTMALAPRSNPHTLRPVQRELLYDDADRIDSWGPGQELEIARSFAPLGAQLMGVHGRDMAQEPLVLAADPHPEQLCWMSSFQ